MAESIHKTFDMPGYSRLVVENIQGPITVTGWDRPQIEVYATPDQGQVEIAIEQHDDTVVARTRVEKGQGRWKNWFDGKHSPRVEYAVSVPHATDLKIKNVEGPISVSRCAGIIRIDNVDGKVALDHAKGDIQVETVNGALSATHIQGDPRLKTVNGKLSVRESKLSGLSAHTVNGKITAAATWHPDAQISLHSVNGDCELTVPADFRAQASAHGINFSVTTGNGETINRQFSGWNGTVGPQTDLSAGPPQANISFHTVNGHLRIDHSAPSAATKTQFVKQAPADPGATGETKAEPVQVKVAQEPADAAPLKNKGRKSQLEILQMVERGEMSVQEALEIL
jgi:hypothetical protein